MKIINLSIKARLWPVGKAHLLKKLNFFLLILFAFALNSCKKEILLPKNAEPPRFSKITTIPYSQFIKSINLNATGSLSAVLSGQKDRMMSTEALASDLKLEMDSVKLLHLGDTLSYVISIKPQTQRATAFQNLTIQVVKEKTTAYLTTYYPEKEWIDNWRLKRKTAFKGKILFNKISLNDVGLNAKNINGAGLTNNENGLKGKIIASISNEAGLTNRISLEAGQCETLIVYTVVAHQCSTGDWPGSCPWEGQGLTLADIQNIYGGNSYPPYFTLERTIEVTCNDNLPNLPIADPGTPGVGGTTPNPPPGYDPCNGGTPPVGEISFERGTRLMVTPPTECDPLPGGLYPLTVVNQYGPYNYVDMYVSISSPIINNNISLDYDFVGITDYFTESEFDALVENLSNDFTEDPIQLYMLACYKNSKLLHSSIYSISGYEIQIGEYYLVPHYNSRKDLVFYSAWRNSNLGIEYIVKASALNAFKEKYTLYRSAANLFYMNGKPSYWQIQIGAGDYWEGLLESHKAAFTDPMYYLYLGHVFVGVTTNLKTVPNTNEPIKFTSASIRNTKKVSIKINNMSMEQYKNAISQKYNSAWQDIGNGRFQLEVGQNRYISNPAASVSGEPTIYYFRKGVDVGRFRFNN